MNQYLYPYQRDGIVFLWKHFKENRGCVLADDMGLGKTIQVYIYTNVCSYYIKVLNLQNNDGLNDELKLYLTVYADRELTSSELRKLAYLWSIHFCD